MKKKEKRNVFGSYDMAENNKNKNGLLGNCERAWMSDIGPDWTDEDWDEDIYGEEKDESGPQERRRIIGFCGFSLFFFSFCPSVLFGRPANARTLVRLFCFDSFLDRATCPSRGYKPLLKRVIIN